MIDDSRVLTSFIRALVEAEVDKMRFPKGPTSRDKHFAASDDDIDASVVERPWNNVKKK